MQTHIDGHGRGGTAFVHLNQKLRVLLLVALAALGQDPASPGGWHTHSARGGCVNEGVEEKGFSPEKPCWAKGGACPRCGPW